MIDNKNYIIKDWSFTSQKKSISNSESIDNISNKYNLSKIPDSIFGENFIKIENKKINFNLEISAGKGLEFCKFDVIDKNLIKIDENNYNNYDYNNSLTFKPKVYKVKINTEKIEAEEEETDMDWTYSTLYKGTINSSSYKYEFNPKIEIPKERLTIENVIQFYDDVYFYEDDLGDFGYTQFRCRYRVMKDCAFFLLRSYIRIDNVMMRLIDTRYFIDFNDNKIIRDFTVKEDIYSNIKNQIQINSEFILNQNQSDIVYEKLPIIHKTLEVFYFK